MPHRGWDLWAPAALWLAVLTASALSVLVIRRKWRRAVERAEEVRRLVEMTAQESARAEWEEAAASRYDYHPAELNYDDERREKAEAMCAGTKQCAVCHSHTTTRCSRCKAVRYCSGRCQIIHWRQGHKDNCRPPDVSKDDVIGQDCDPDTVGSMISELPKAAEDSFATKLTGLGKGNHTSSDSLFSSSIFTDDQEVDSVIFTEESCSVPSISSSGCCTSDDDQKPYTNTKNDDCVQSTPVEVRKSSYGFNAAISGEVATLLADSSKKFTRAPIRTFTSDCSSSFKSTCNDGHKSVPIDCSTSPAEYSSSGSTHLADCHDVRDDLSSNFNGTFSDPTLLKCSKKEIPDNKISQNSLKNLAEPYSSQDLSAVHTNSSKREDGLITQSYKSNKEECLLISKASKPPVDCHSSGKGAFVSRGFPPASTNSVAESSKIAGRPGVIVGSSLKISVQKASQELWSSKFSNPGKMLFSYELFAKLYNERVELYPCGFVNLGNSCYVNVVLQCLIFTRPLTAYLLQGYHGGKCQKKTWCFICEFEGLAKHVKRGRSSISPTGILSQIHNIGSHLIHGKQEDAHEFLRHAIDTMQRICLSEPGAGELGIIAEETSLMQLTFGGYLRSKIKCLNCHVTSECFERMMDLTVEIQGDIENLDDALHRFTSTELLDGENKYRCDRCKSYERAKKKLMVAEAPNILTIVLKRFQSGKFGKINKAIKFPECLNLTPYMSNAMDKGAVYNLYAVIVHVDIMNAAFSGHYVCYLKNFQGRWFKADDSLVRPVEWERVSSKGAYMLLYARCSPHAPSLMNDAKMKHRSFSVAKPSLDGGKFVAGSNSSRILDTHLFPFHSVRCTTACPTMDSSSDSSSILSCSDEASCSTESTRDSTSADDYGNFSPSRFSDSDCSSYSLSPDWRTRYLNKITHPSELHRRESSTASLTESSTMQNLTCGFGIPGDSPVILHPDRTKHCRTLTEQFSLRETDWSTNPSETKLGSLTRRPTRDKTAPAS